MASEEDLKAARDICFRADVGESVQQNILIKLIAADRAAARAETWKEAIAIVKYADAKANWPLKEGSLIKALEAAAGSKTKVFSREDEQKNQGR